MSEIANLVDGLDSTCGSWTLLALHAAALICPGETDVDITDVAFDKLSLLTPDDASLLVWEYTNDVRVRVGLDSLSPVSFPRLVVSVLYALGSDLITAFLPIVTPEDAWTELVGIVAEVGLGSNPFNLALVVKLTRDLHLSS